jgi:hypothetical protein
MKLREVGGDDGPVMPSFLPALTDGDPHVLFGRDRPDGSFHIDDTLIAFTDGLLEARDPHGEQFGLPRLLQTINTKDLDDGHRLLDAVAAAVTRHTTSTRSDDQTLVNVRPPRWHGPDSPDLTARI